jgi:gliding motility-associated-like protein
VGTGSCTDSDQIDITVNATPDATITDPGDFCTTDAATFLNAATAGGTWSGTGITDPATGEFDPSVAGAGSHTISYSVTVSGCTGTDDIVIDVFDTPDATITDPGDFCSDDAPYDLSAASAGGTWSGTGITDPANGTFDPSVAGAGTYTITYNVGTGSCTDSDQIDITVNATPDATITDSGDFCTTDAATFLNAATAGGTWSGTGITDPATGEFDPSVAGAGSHTISYSVTVSGCTGTDDFVIDVFDTPDATITDPGDFCSDDAPYDLSAASAGGTWSGTGITDPANGTFDPAVAGAGDHIITYDVGTGTCADSDQITIHVDAMPSVSVSSEPDMCISDAAVTLNATPSGGSWSGNGVTGDQFNPGTAGAGDHTITYEYSNGACTASESITIHVDDEPDASITAAGPFCVDGAPVNLTAATPGGTWSGTGITDATAGTFDPATAGLGTHVITYSVSNGACSATDQTQIEVVNAPDSEIDPAGPFCLNDTAVQLSAATSGGVWSGNGIVDSLAGIFDPTVAGVGEHTITYAVSLGTCGSSSEITLEVIQSGDAGIQPAGPFCYDDFTVQIETNQQGGIWTGEYVNENGIFNVGAAGPGTHTVSYTIEGACGDTDQQNITVYPSDFTVSHVTSDPHCLGSGDGTVNFSVSGGTPPYSVSWTTGSSDTTNVTGLVAGGYSFTLTDAHGCSTDIPYIQINEGDRDCLRIPNAFTPNDDGVNDSWIIENLIYYESAQVTIYNRWGQLLYEGGPQDEPWDGTYNGNPVPTGSYLYVLDLDSEMENMVGVVTLVR